MTGGIVVDGYIRVSQVRGRSGERFISPALQREQITAWTAAHGYRVGELLEELDVSGARRTRPQLERAIRRVEAGESRGLVVANTDRFGRSTLHGLQAIERIQAAGGTFVAVAEGFDLATDGGRMALRQMLNMAEWQLDRVRSGWDAARERAIARGAHLGSKSPTGYRRTRSGRLAVDQCSAPAISELFARRATGTPISALGRRLEARGVKTPYGNAHWCYTSTRGLLRNRVYLGEVRSGTFVKTGTHPPLTDPATWQLAQSPAEIPVPRARLPGGVANVRCAGCRMVMNAHTTYARDGRAVRHYSCRRSFSGGRCPAPASITSSLLEPYVEDEFFARLARRPVGRAKLAAAESAVERAERALVVYRDNDRVAATLGPARFADGVDVRQARLERVLRGLAICRARVHAPLLPDASELEQRWPDLTIAERRDVLQAVIESVFVRRGREPVDERVIVCGRGESPGDLPRRGEKHAPVRPLPAGWRPAEPASAPDGPALWSERRIRTQLELLTRGRASWPDFDAFHRAGRGRLYRQVEATGGGRVWADRLGLRFSDGSTSKRRWTDERIRTTLSAYLHGKPTWPTGRQFTEDGFGAVRWAVNRHGGVEYWAAQFALARPNRCAGKGRYWTDARIERELRAFVAESGEWPMRKAFRDAGLGGLRRAVDRTGGRERWEGSTAGPSPTIR